MAEGLFMKITHKCVQLFAIVVTVETWCYLSQSYKSLDDIDAF
jgi:hypothetical protein